MMTLGKPPEQHPEDPPTEKDNRRQSPDALREALADLIAALKVEPGIKTLARIESYGLPGNIRLGTVLTAHGAKRLPAAIRQAEALL